MALIVLGLVLWTWPHLMSEYTPGLRAGLSEKKARPLVAIIALLAIVLMVIGYRGADYIPVYDPPAGARHATYLLMVLAVAAMGLGHSKSRLKRWIRHPMFTGAILWGTAHLLVRGDLASVLLFGGMILWAVAGWVVTNARHPEYSPPTGGSMAGDLRLAVITLVLFVVIVLIHGWLGPQPFQIS
ncbi:NnrU family protein [Pseudooceanicola algae]|nr:NnrU family protein [Pseudooceanicola algae]